MSRKLNAITQRALSNRNEIDSAEIVESGKDGRMEVSRQGQQRTSGPLLFVCPVCGGNEIIERMRDKRRIRAFETGEFEVSDPDGRDAYNCHYYCGDCGSLILHEKLVYFKDRTHLGKWLSQQPGWESLEEPELHENRYMDMSALVGSKEEALRPGEVRFTCPECGATQLDECWVTETPIKFYEDGSVELGCPDYDVEEYHYRCRRCKSVIEDEWGITENKERLMAYLKKHTIDAA